MEINFLKHNLFGAWTKLGGSAFQTGTTRDEKKYLRTFVLTIGTESLSEWPLDDELVVKEKKASKAKALLP